jgi:hypothetical protein
MLATLLENVDEKMFATFPKNVDKKIFTTVQIKYKSQSAWVFG